MRNAAHPPGGVSEKRGGGGEFLLPNSPFLIRESALADSPDGVDYRSIHPFDNCHRVIG